MKELQELEVILKTVERCNIACSYCYFFFFGDESYKAHPPYISQAIVNDTALFLRDGAVDLGLSRIQIDFHGGEPLMQKKDAFDVMCKTFRGLLDPVVKLDLSLQTNAMLVDSDWVSLIREHSVGVGVSIDGPREYHDAFRVDHRGRGTYDRVVEGVSKFRRPDSNGTVTNDLGALCVINPKHDSRRIYRHLVDDLGIFGMDFLLPDLTHDSIGTEEIEAYGSYLCEVFDEWAQDDDPNIDVRFFRLFMSKVLGRHSNFFPSPHAPITAAAITIGSDGSVGPDDTLRSSKIWSELGAWNVREMSLASILELPLFREVTEQEIAIPEGCRNCCWENTCGGGMLINRFSEVSRFDKPSIFCEGLKSAYAAVVAYLLNHGVPAKQVIAGVLPHHSDETISYQSLWK